MTNTTITTTTDYLDVVITFRGTVRLLKTLTDRAKDRGVTRSDLIRECVASSLR